MSVAARFEADSSEDLSSPFFFNASHWRAMDGIIEGINARDGIMIMTGPTGCGKTMLMRAISESLSEDVTPLFLQYASLNFREFVNFLHKSLDVADHVLDAANKAVALRKFLYAQAERGETAVVLIDEAQNLEPDVLRMLPKLACFDQLENGTNVGLQFMLTGGSELREVLADSDLTEVRESISRDYELRFFSRKELKHFLEKRLAPLSRFTPEPITEDAIAAVGKYTGGSPRLVGMICSHAMLFAAENPGRSIDAAMIEEAAEAQMIDPVDAPFAHEEESLDEETGPFSSADLSGDDADDELAMPLRADDDAGGYSDLGAQRMTAQDEGYDDLDRASDDAAYDEYDDDFGDSGFDVMDDINNEVRMDYEDEFEAADTSGRAGAVASALSAGSVMDKIRSAVSSRSADAGQTRIVGAGRKARNPKREAKPVEKRSMRTRVAGRREKQLKLVGGAAAVLGLVVGVYMVRTELSSVFASGSDPAEIEEMQRAQAPFGGGTGNGYQPRVDGPATDEPGGISIIGMPDEATGTGFSGSETDLASRDMGQSASGLGVSTGGWGAKVEVQAPTTDPSAASPQITLPELKMPKLPDAGVGLARGALDMIDTALEKGKSVLPEDMSGALDVARADIQDLRVTATANGATGDARDARVAEMVAEGDAYFERRLYIAPARSNAYDSYRAALDLAPGNEAALKGIEKLRAFYAKKAEEARANKQWDNANRFFETALGISQRKSVR